jgi:CcmD family protein
MIMVRRGGPFACGVILVLGLLLGATAFGFQPPPQTEYLPVKPGTVVEQLPAAPLLIAAYTFVWIALIVYLWTIWRRISKVEADMRALARRSPGGGGAR